MLEPCLIVVQIVLLGLVPSADTTKSICISDPYIQNNFNFECIKHQLILTPKAKPIAYFKVLNSSCKII